MVMFVESEALMPRRRQSVADIVAVIPAYQAEKTIADVVSRTRRRVARCIVIDDGSTDKTGVLARRAGAELITHAGNRGKGAALRSGLLYLREEEFNYCVLLDADGQHDPNEIPRLVDAARRANADVVCGTRMSNPRGMPWLRRVTNTTMSRITSWLCRITLSDTQCGFRLLSQQAVKVIEITKSNFEVETEILLEAARNKLAVTEAPVSSIYADDHSSHIHPVRDTWRFVRLVAMIMVRRLVGK